MQRWIFPICGIVGLTGTAHSQTCTGDPGIVLTVSDPSPAIGMPFTLTAQTSVGDLVVLFIGVSGASINTPYGSLCVSLPAAIVTFTQLAPSLPLATSVPFDTQLVGLTPHFQFLAKSPGTGPVHRSNALSVVIADGPGVPFPSESIATQTGPGEIALADLDGDSILDLVVPNFDTKPAEILPGIGDGNFGSAIPFTSATEHYAAIARDIDGDADLDLLLTTFAQVQSYKNDGLGQFSFWGGFAAGGFSAKLTTGDFDLDGDLDVATANALDGKASVLVGDGTGSFAAPVTYSVGANPRGIAATDLNLDGDLDLAVSRTGVGAGVQLLYGQLASGFVAIASIPTGDGPGVVLANDLDADGRSDLVVANTNVDTVTVLRNQASSFVSTTLAAGDQPNGLAIADLDLDGVLDIAVANAGSISLGLYRGLGSATFAPMTIQPAAGAPSYLGVGDLDQNGHPDVVASLANDRSVAVLLDRNGNGFGLEGVPDLTSTGGIRAAVLGDFNLDSNMDVFGIDNTSSSSKLLRYYGDGFGTFATASSLSIPPSPSSVVAADLDNDSDLDVLTSSQNATTGVLMSNGAGGFASSTSFGLVGGDLSIGDLDGDGFVDFAATGSFTSGGSPVLQGFKSLGTGAFSVWPNVSTMTSPTDVALGDLDLDGDLDAVITSTSSTQLQVYRGDGLGGFASATLVPVGAQTRAVALADLDGDGDLDAALAHSSLGQIALCYGDGLGSFPTVLSIPIPGSASDVELADFDGDLRLDVAAVSTFTKTVSISFAAPGGGYPTRREFRSAPGSRQLVIGRVNHDEFDDIVTVSTSPTSSITISLHR